MRQRVKMVGLISHTSPTHSIMSEESILRVKFNRGTITKEELRKLANYTVHYKEKRVTVYAQVKIFGQWMPISKNISIEEYQRQGFALR